MFLFRVDLNYIIVIVGLGYPYVVHVSVGWELVTNENTQFAVL